MAKAKKNKKISQSHKRIGTHQKRTPKFMKTYWPYLPLMVGAGILVIFSFSWKLAHSDIVRNHTNQANAGISQKALQEKINALEQKQASVNANKSLSPNPKGD
jgi:hypothetical protein